MEIRTPGAMCEAADKFVNGLRPSTAAVVIGLVGDLGSGKTTFVKGASQALGVKDVVASPTFVIQKIYQLSGHKFRQLIHIDAYRLETAEDTKPLHWGELFEDPGNLIFVEWPERIEGALPKNTKYITFGYVSEGVRDISYT